MRQGFPVEVGVPVEGGVADGEVVAIGTVDGLEDGGAVFDGAADGAELVHGPAEGHGAGAGNEAEGGAEAGDAATRAMGEEMEPRVSEPMEKATQPADVADAGPAEEPLEPCLGFQGLRVRPPYHLSPMASAPRVSLAMRTAPAASRRWTTVASSSMV